MTDRPSADLATKATNRNRIPCSFFNPHPDVRLMQFSPSTYAAVYRRIYGRPPHKRGGANVYNAEEAEAILDWFVQRSTGNGWANAKPTTVYVRRVMRAAASGKPYPSDGEMDRRYDAARFKQLRRIRK
jgi:hypothetical protein